MSDFELNTKSDERLEVRFPTNPVKSPLRPFKKLKVLVLTANSTQDHIRVTRHVRAIEDALDSAKFRINFDDVIHRPVSKFEDISEHIKDRKPHIVHFIGHGVAGGVGLKVEDETGIERIISNEALFGLFENSRRIRCVILSACYSDTLAKAIHKSVDCVIGMSNQIGEIESAKFAKAFYDEIGEGKRFDEAFDVARKMIARKGDDDSENLKLFYRHSSPLGRAINKIAQR